MTHPLSLTFEKFAERECKDSSALYYALSHEISKDEALLKVAEQVANGQPAPNLLFAAAHYLLRKKPTHSLARYYASICETPHDPSVAYQDFKRFVSDNESEIVKILKERLVQTNEVRRSAYLFPCILTVADYFNGQTMALIEVGTSAGLNLLCDRYFYTYNEKDNAGDPTSDVHIKTDSTGVSPNIRGAFPPISHRIGLDLNIVDLNEADQIEWLKSLVWPEHHERRDLLEKATRSFRGDELDLRVGDGFAMLDEIEREIPDTSVLCIYHTHVANQISQEAKNRLLKFVDDVGARRNIAHIYNNIHPTLHLTLHRDGEKIDRPIAKVDGHARWIEWLPNAS